MKAIRTQRLRLVPVTAANAAQLWHLLQEPDLRTYQDLPTVGAQAFGEMVARRPQRLHGSAIGRFEWLVCLAGSRKPVGWVSLRIADRGPAGGEIGYSLLRQHRGRGIAAEAVRALVAEAFESGRLSRVSAYCVPENKASRTLLERIGFLYEGTLPHGATVSGRAVDVLMYRIDRAQWRDDSQAVRVISEPARAMVTARGTRS